MGGFRVAITPRMVSEWATTPCWDMQVETSLANSSMADHTHCCLVTCITDTERKTRIQNRDGPALQLGVPHSSHSAMSGLRTNVRYHFLITIPLPNSRNCPQATGVGASIIRSFAAAVLGKGITSRKLSAPARIIK